MAARLSYTSTLPSGFFSFSRSRKTYSVRSSRSGPKTSKYSSNMRVEDVGYWSLIDSIAYSFGLTQQEYLVDMSQFSSLKEMDEGFIEFLCWNSFKEVAHSLVKYVKIWIMIISSWYWANETWAACLHLNLSSQLWKSLYIISIVNTNVFHRAHITTHFWKLRLIDHRWSLALKGHAWNIRAHIVELGVILLALWNHRSNWRIHLGDMHNLLVLIFTCSFWTIVYEWITFWSILHFLIVTLQYGTCHRHLRVKVSVFFWLRFLGVHHSFDAWTHSTNPIVLQQTQVVSVKLLLVFLWHHPTNVGIDIIDIGSSMLRNQLRNIRAHVVHVSLISLISDHQLFHQLFY